MSKVEKHYDKSADREWNRLLEHRTEFAVTMKALAEYLPPPPVDILDIGAGPGRYALELAKIGYKLTLVDISKVSLDLAKQKAAEANVDFEAIIQSDATKLSELSNDSFDSVLIFGPLYHLIENEDRKAAVMEACRVLKPGKTLFAAFITRFAPYRHSASEEIDWLINNNDYAWELLNNGKHVKGKQFPSAYFSHPDEIQPLMEECGLQTKVLMGCEGIVSGHENQVNQLVGDD
jgi:ubiquinone/menaquinone biosynthesis C-methylase UbiE